MPGLCQRQRLPPRSCEPGALTQAASEAAASTSSQQPTASFCNTSSVAATSMQVCQLRIVKTRLGHVSRLNIVAASAAAVL